MLSKRLLSLLLLGVAPSLFTGCQPEEKISHHSVAHLNDMKRLLAAIVLPAKDEKQPKTWFIKAVGAESEMGQVLEPFHEFLRSITFRPDGTPEWTKLPQGWTEEKEKKVDLRFATIDIGLKGKLTVAELAGAASVKDNVNRWRGQLGLVGLDLVDLELFFRPERVGGRDAIVVDMIGPRNDAAMPLRVPPKMPPMDAENPEGPSFQWQTPEGWQEIPPTNKLYVLSFRDKEGKVAINVSDFPRDGGGVLLNVNRWRAQMKLGPLDDSQAGALPTVAIGNATGKLVDVSGPQGNRIVGAILIRSSNSLFFKMMGPSAPVELQKPAFEAFLKSVNFGS